MRQGTWRVTELYLPWMGYLFHGIGCHTSHVLTPVGRLSYLEFHMEILPVLPCAYSTQ